MSPKTKTTNNAIMTVDGTKVQQQQPQKKNKTTTTTTTTTKNVDHPWIKSLSLLDPLLQFLTKRSGKTLVPLSMLQAVLPEGADLPRKKLLLQHIPELVNLGILRLSYPATATATATTAADSPKNASQNQSTTSLSWDTAVEIGFPAPPMQQQQQQQKQENNEDWIGGVVQRKQSKIIVPVESLCGSTKTGAKRRLAALKRAIKAQRDETDCQGKANKNTVGDSFKGRVNEKDGDANVDTTETSKIDKNLHTKDWNFESHQKMTTNLLPAAVDQEDEEEEVVCHETKVAQKVLQDMFQFVARPPPSKQLSSSSAAAAASLATSRNTIPEYILPKQASYAGSHPAQTSKYSDLSEEILAKIPRVVLNAFGIDCGQSSGKINGRRLYSHQAMAIASAIEDKHTLVCTSTGSGKSLCFLVPALAAAYNSSKNGNTRGISLIMFPTKALAQDQLRKLEDLLSKHPDLQEHIFPATLDGDSPHQLRSDIAQRANIILTNPDTLHAAILPHWEKRYKRIMHGLKYVVIDEMHVYEGMFGTHVALVLSRLQRLAIVARCDQNEPLAMPTFLSSSATLEHPQYHFRLLCPIPKSAEILVLTAKDDGSPRSAKHFFVWNPPLLSMMTGENTGSVFYPKAHGQRKDLAKAGNSKKPMTNKPAEEIASTPYAITTNNAPNHSWEEIKLSEKRTSFITHEGSRFDGLRRRHACDETGLLLARAIINNVRCIAFCKTRSTVEWVYERTTAILGSDTSTKHLVEMVQPYRGGYKLSDRREIEKKLFEKKLIGVVATSALELGVDIGGVELTFHVGYPSSISSLLQQAGRAGRGGGASLQRSSLSVVVAFGSAVEQYMWKRPECLLAKGIHSRGSFPINAGVVSGHLLCASKEFPLMENGSPTVLRSSNPAESVVVDAHQENLSDSELFGSREIFAEALNALCGNGSIVSFQAPIASGGAIKAFKARAFIDKPWTRVSIRSVEPISFSIVDISHPRQGGLTNGIHDEQAVLDNLPYSRVFYHAFPGAIILHRGQKYKVLSMTRPPPYDPCSIYKRNLNLAAFARPTNERYMTRPLSTQTITIVKQIERVDIESPFTSEKSEEKESPTTTVVDPYFDIADQTEGSFAGCGIITAKRTVHGFKKLSLITREEMSRHELSLPEMEYDSFGIWLDCEAETLGPFLGADYGSGVHALSHSLLAVSPLFVSCARSDLECDHATFAPTRVCIFDERAGGSGTCAELWKSLFVPNGLLERAIDLLASCSSCSQHDNDLGCPACLQSGGCVKFNQDLSRSAALIIGRRMLKRLQRSEMYKRNVEATKSPATGEEQNTPRKKRRTQGMRRAKEMISAKERLFVVGRPNWPGDENNEMLGGRQERAD